MNNLTRKQTDLIVSILNAIAEESGIDIDNEGFGYDTETLEIMANECGLTEALEYTWNSLCNLINERKLLTE